MSDSHYAYDENAEVWPYFAFTLVSVVLIPLTVSHFWGYFKKSGNDSGKPLKPQHRAFRESLASRQLWSSSWTWGLAACWLVLALLLAVIFKQPEGEETVKLFDPYDVLGIGMMSTEREIKTAYRKLSLQFHPDKIKQVGEFTKEMIEERYVQITKAYRALTDEDTRENLRLFGHPDGPQPVSHGIALPSFLVGGGSWIVVAAYAIGVGIILPTIVGSWWSRQQKRTRKGLLQDTASLFCETIIKEQTFFITPAMIIRVIAQSADMDLEVPSLSVDERVQKLHDYLERKTGDTGDDFLSLKVAATTARLLMGFMDIASQFKTTLLCQRILELHRSVVQAVPLDMSRLGEYLQLPNASASSVLIKGNQDSAALMKTVSSARSYMPRLQLLKAEFKVNGEDKVTTNSQTYLQLKFVVRPIAAPMPAIDKSILDQPVGEGLVDPGSYNKREPALPNATAPYFPLDVPTRWYAFINGERDDLNLLGPVEVANMDLSNLSLSDEELTSGDKVVIGTLNFQLPSPSPPFEGKFPFRIMLLSSTYFSCDIVSGITMEVVAPSESLNDPDDKTFESDSDEEEDFSDIDTDTDCESDEEIAEDTAAKSGKAQTVSDEAKAVDDKVVEKVEEIAQSKN